MKKVIAVFIAYNGANTLEDFYQQLPKELFDQTILVDDASVDNTFTLAKKLGIKSYRNKINRGYGGNIKRALKLALSSGADVIVDIHPDGEYKPSSIPKALSKIENGAEFVLGNRFTHLSTPLKSGMFFWKLLPLIFLNLVDRIILNVPINDFHQGFRVYTKAMLRKINFEVNSNGYLFSFELITQAAYHKIKFAEVPVQTHYRGKKRGASFKNSLGYSLGTFKIIILFIFAKLGVSVKMFSLPKR